MVRCAQLFTEIGFPATLRHIKAMLKAFCKKAIVAVLTLEAKLVLYRYQPHIVAVTGSVGKTSAKDAIFAAVSAKGGFIRKSEKSFNSEIGVPLTIIGRPNAWANPFAWFKNIAQGALLIVSKRSYPQWLILEIGADRPGDIKAVAGWLKPDVVVVTRFAPVPVHVEFFGSPEALIQEKAELVKALKEDGTLVLSAEDDDVLTLKDLVRKAKVTTFGFSKTADVSASKVKVRYEGRGAKRRAAGIAFRVRYGQQSATIELAGVVGRQAAYAALAGLSVGVSEGLALEELSAPMCRFDAPPGRMRILEGIKHTTVIDDSYNSSPVAAREALDALENLAIKGRRIAVLADMLELGRYSVQEHKDIGAYAAKRCDVLMAVGVRSRDTVDGAQAAGMDAGRIMQFDDARTAGRALEGFIAEGDAILIKGSQGMRMERIVEEVMAHPERAGELLVRQEDEWRRR